ncbi:NAD-dependent epimerase/dehydratase family protein [Shimia aestuarii]|uniref:NAD dependent epimerase/dehydratase family protein n=1 Tax=Shimia aestuarii TaxID=254406 RepID=A0A1I4TT00_9RHOB|nr:NAD-dependent epimerase/dehydratase family protein [Shimia aestuarii]SFM79791.1 NAD dependent epimerase/dehydratase family protein [Shimia aestuarii]
MTSASPRVLLIPGATGKLGRLMRRAWERAQLPGWRPVWIGRQAATGVDVVWQPGNPAPCDADAVLALWGVVPGGGDLDDNTTLARAAMALGRESGAARVLQCSSSAVYGPGARLSEDTPCAPANAYGAAKLAMEAVISKETGKTGPPACALRLANVVGADSLFDALSSEAPMVIDRFADGQGPLRSYATPSGIWRAVETLLQAETLPGVINVATPAPVGMDALARAAGRKFDWRDAPEGALAEVALETGLLQGMSGDTAPVTPEEMISDWRQLKESRA